MMGHRKQCALYIRVSTNPQVQGNSLATQKSQMLHYAKERDFAVVDIYRDAGLSGKNTDRPELQRLIEDAESGKFDVVMVWAVDRISRNLVDLVDLIEHLRDCGVEFISISQQFDTTEPAGMLILHLLGSFAQFERELLIERTKAGHIQRLQQSDWSCGPPPFGYRKEKGKLVEVPDEVNVVKQILGRYLELKSIRGVTNELNAQNIPTRKGKGWYTNTVKGILKNPVYAGANVYGRHSNGDTRLKSKDNWTVVPGMRKPIIQQSIFDKVQELLGGQRDTQVKTEKQEYPFSGKVFCPECGSPMYGKTRVSRGKVFRYYQCNGNVHKGLAFCSGTSWPADEIEQQLTESKGIIDIVETTAMPTEKTTQQKELDAIKYKISRLFELYENDGISKKEFSERLAALTSKQKTLL